MGRGTRATEIFVPGCIGTPGDLLRFLRSDLKMPEKMQATESSIWSPRICTAAAKSRWMNISAASFWGGALFGSVSSGTKTKPCRFLLFVFAAVFVFWEGYFIAQMYRGSCSAPSFRAFLDPLWGFVHAAKHFCSNFSSAINPGAKPTILHNIIYDVDTAWFKCKNASNHVVDQLVHCI